MNQFDINDIIKTLKSTSGSDFFNTIVLQLHRVIGADFTFIARVDKKRFMSKTIALATNEGIAENFEYSLTNTPCEDVTADNVCIFPGNIAALYPKDQLLIDMGVEGYVGAPLHNCSGELMGIMVALFQRNIENAQDVAALLELFAGRVSSEIERADTHYELMALNHTLEQQIEERTQELKQTLKQLKSTQNQVIEKERLASLGSLVAGVAHEVNTPLGVAILAASTIQVAQDSMRAKLASGKLSKSQLTRYSEDVKEAQHAISFNLTRAAELVSNFKLLAKEHHTDDKSEIDLNAWVTSVVSSLRPLMKHTDVSIQLQLQDSPVMAYVYPARIAQIITNVVTNCINHAFPSSHIVDNKTIDIELSSKYEFASLVIIDNGCGIDQKTIKHILEPFFTTKRSFGGTGLGLSIVNNLVTGSLHGEIDVESKLNVGTRVTIKFPTMTSTETASKVEHQHE